MMKRSTRIKLDRVGTAIISALIVLATITLVLYLAHLNRQNQDDPLHIEIEPYDASQKLLSSMERLESGEYEPASVITRKQVMGQKISLTFEGLPGENVVDEVLLLLRSANIKATFFIPGVDIRRYSEVVRKIAADGHEIGNYTLHGERDMQLEDASALVRNFCRTEEIIHEVTGSVPRELRCYITDYQQNVLDAAGAAGYTTINMPTAYINYQSFKSQDELNGFFKQLPYTSILSIKLVGVIDPAEIAAQELSKPSAGRPVSDQPEKVKPATPGSATPLTPDEKDQRLLDIISWTMQAMNFDDFNSELEAIYYNNQGVTAEPMECIYTSEAAVSYLFHNLGNQKELDSVLMTLRKLRARANFFVTYKELLDYPQQIRQITSAGHELGIAIIPDQKSDFFSVIYELLETKKLLETEFDVPEVQLCLQPWGDFNDFTLEAVHAANLDIISDFTRITHSDVQTMTDPGDILDTVFGTREYELHRGHCALFRMNYFEQQDTLLGDTILAMEGNRNIYPVKPFSEIRNNDKATYQYPLAKEAILPQVYNQVITDKYPTPSFEAIRQHYLGNPFIRDEYRLPGFNSEERLQLDQTGKINNNQNTAFLTIDDWGTDASITALLDVLRKHNVKATFYVITANIPNNPNLLRAIAAEGHDIASHTHTHQIMTAEPVPLPNGTNYYGPMDAAAEEALPIDYTTAYQVLQSIVGDMVNERGNPILNATLRPPTMAVSRRGMEIALECGYRYIVNGSYTTHDYEAVSADALYDSAIPYLESGSVIIFHSTTESKYTAEVLDRILTENAEKPSEEQLHFARISDYLS